MAPFRFYIARGDEFTVTIRNENFRFVFSNAFRRLRKFRKGV
jgi:hypothetical protein